MTAVSELGFSPLEALPIEQDYVEIFSGKEHKTDSKELALLSHTYQPPRNFDLLSQTSFGTRADIVSGVNSRIHEECYKKIFVDQKELPPGMLASFYGTLREWMMDQKPEDFGIVREHLASSPDAEYRVLGDPYLHLILPLEKVEDQDMLVKAGLAAFEEDLGFRPRGFWLPETAVSNQTLQVLQQNGIEFVVLRDNQVQNPERNPIYVPLSNGERIAVVVADSGISGSVSFDDWATWDANGFLEAHRFYPKEALAVATDTEFYGHHGRGKDQFLKWVTRPDVQAAHGFAPYDVKRRLQELQEDPYYTGIWNNSSWSDLGEHDLGRWRGDPVCGCDGEWEEDSITYKRELYLTLREYGNEIGRQLDVKDSSWREHFVPFFLGVRRSMYAHGNIEEDVQKLQQEIPGLNDPETKRLYYAELARLTGMTSCFNFFGGLDRPERDIARINIGEIEQLVPGITKLRPQQQEVRRYVRQGMGKEYTTAA